MIERRVSVSAVHCKKFTYEEALQIHKSKLDSSNDSSPISNIQNNTSNHKSDIYCSTTFSVDHESTDSNIQSLPYKPVKSDIEILVACQTRAKDNSEEIK